MNFRYICKTHGFISKIILSLFVIFKFHEQLFIDPFKVYNCMCFVTHLRKGTVPAAMSAMTTRTIAQLELYAAKLGSDLYAKIREAIPSISNVMFWTDSMIVYHWLQSRPQYWKTFVANRVSQIQHTTKGFHWRHVPGCDNPADLVSRGCLGSELLHEMKWWQGPSWLSLPEQFWPQTIAANQNDMTTILAEIEGCLNSRPITPMSEDPSGLTALTPGHFLTGENLQLLPSINLTQIPINRLTHWQIIQQQLQRFWKRWRTEYLQKLQARSKWLTKGKEQVRVGQLIIIHEDNVQPSRWPLARITKTHPGRDNIIRVISAKTIKGNEVTRPIAKIGLIPEIDRSDPTEDKI
uniref:DUF5641 domain-containing protein n=1 Tax=Anopheles stephensi TaxID=30069 RepID=A0A182YRV4_ANOST